MQECLISPWSQTRLFRKSVEAKQIMCIILLCLPSPFLLPPPPLSFTPPLSSTPPLISLPQIKDKFCLDLNEEEAVQHIQSLIDESVKAMMAVFVEQIHKWAQVLCTTATSVYMYC